MPDDFRRAYAALTEFVAHHPEIEIGDSVVSLPESVRTAFYDRFNAARDAFVEERFGKHLSETAVLLEKYRQAEEKVAAWLSLEEPSTVSVLHRFLCDPKAALTRELFDPLFDLLKGRESIDSFEKKACDGIETLYPGVFRGGYEKWAVLSLAGLLEAERALRVQVRNLNPGERVKSAAYAPVEEVPSPEESTRFAFSQVRNAIFAVPDFIIHLAGPNRFLGIRSEFRESVYNALNPSPYREWVAIDTELLILLESGLTLVYVADEAASVALVADAAKFCRPDLVLWCIDTRSLTPKEALERMARVTGRLRPTVGSYIIAKDPWPESREPAGADSAAPAQDGVAGVHLLTVGYDESKLRPVARAVLDWKNPAAQTDGGSEHA